MYDRRTITLTYDGPIKEDWAFEYEADGEEADKVLGRLLYTDYLNDIISYIPDGKKKEFKSVICAKLGKLIWDIDGLEDILVEIYNDELKEHFNDEAYDSIKE